MFNGLSNFTSVIELDSLNVGHHWMVAYFFSMLAPSILVLYALGYGTQPNLARHNNFDHNTMATCLAVGLLNSITSLFAGKPLK